MTPEEYHLSKEIGQVQALSRLLTSVWRLEQDRQGRCEGRLFYIGGIVQDVLGKLCEEAQGMIERTDSTEEREEE
jgi:hypothetical protein